MHELTKSVLIVLRKDLARRSARLSCNSCWFLILYAMSLEKEELKRIEHKIYEE